MHDEVEDFDEYTSPLSSRKQWFDFNLKASISVIGMSKPVTMKTIATDLGLSVQAVSYALRGRKGVSEQTRQRVLRHASEVGYEPDAALHALADFRTGQRKASLRWNTVALVHNWPSASGLLEDGFYGNWFAHLEAAAKARGVAIEVHWLGANSESNDTVWRSIRNRGITGVFVAPHALGANEYPIQLPKQNFQIVTFGPGHLYPNHHTVQFDFYENLRLAWNVLRQRGHERIGLVYAKFQGWRTGHAWRAAYHVEKLLAGGKPGVRMPLEMDGRGSVRQRATYETWLKKGGYDAVISSMHQVINWTAQIDPSCEVVIFNVNQSNQQGIDLNLEQMARTAVELLYLEMQRSLQRDRGLPFRIHIPGKWTDGKSSSKRQTSPKSLSA